MEWKHTNGMSNNVQMLSNFRWLPIYQPFLGVKASEASDRELLIFATSQDNGVVTLAYSVQYSPISVQKPCSASIAAANVLSHLKLESI